MQYLNYFQPKCNVHLPYLHRHIIHSILPHYYSSITPTKNAIKAATSPPTSLLLTARPGLSFCSKAVVVAATDEQLAVPQDHPFGQQFPPSLGAQVDQPVAQVPVGLVTVAADPTGTTTVTEPLMIVVELVGGQDVVWQSRPVRQHPPA